MMERQVEQRKHRLTLFFIAIALSCGLFFCPSFASAVEFAISNDVIPTIELTFNEQTRLENTYLVEQDDVFDRIDVEITTTNNLTFHVKPIRALRNGDYILQFTAYDRIGNALEMENDAVTFTIDSVETGINYVDPPHGVASSENYDVTIRTDDPSLCKYSLVYFSDTLFYDDPTIRTFGNGSQKSTLHTIPQFNMRVSDEFPVSIHVKCEDTLPRINYRELTFTLDTTKPRIQSLLAEPRQITYPTEINGGTFLVTNLSVLADEKVMCKYASEDVAYEEMDWFNRSFTSPNATLIDRTHFTRDTQTRLQFSNFSDASYPYYVQCENLAGLRTDRKQITIDVNLGASLEITIEEPRPYSNSSSQELVVSTNKPSFCEYSLDAQSGMFYPTDSASNNLRIEHRADLGSSFGHGEHDLVIKCTSDSISLKTYEFVVDTTPPLISNFTHAVPDVANQTTGAGSTRYTYFTDELSARWDSDEDYSPISGYEYQIQNAAGTVITDWTQTTSNRATVDRLNLSNLETYYWYVRAQNEVGTWSNTFKSPGVLVDTSLQPDDFHCQNGRLDYDETDIDCGGSCDPCEIDQDCEENADCASDNCLEGVCATNRCNNGVLDGSETDIDCGGDCQPCDRGMGCVSDSDCESLFCRNQTCGTPSCSDDIKNGLETDVDCGGNTTCERCSLQQNCLNNDDCSSSYCNPDYVCDLVSCHNGIRDNDELDVDCGGSCAPCDLTACASDEDCPSGRCNMTSGYCVRSVERETSNPTSATLDSDNDGMPDVWEEEYGFDTMAPSDAQEDFDSDDLTNLREFNVGTNPLLWDTDGDGVPDGEEVARGFDPLDSNSKPQNSFLWFWVLLLVLVIISIGGYYGYNKYMDSSHTTGSNPLLNLKNIFTKKPSRPASTSRTNQRGQSPSQRSDPSASTHPQQTPVQPQQSISSEPLLSQGRLEANQILEERQNEDQGQISPAHRRFLREQKAKQRNREKLFNAFDSESSDEKRTASEEETGIETEARTKIDDKKEPEHTTSVTPEPEVKAKDHSNHDNVSRMFSNLRNNKKKEANPLSETKTATPLSSTKKAPPKQKKTAPQETKKEREKVPSPQSKEPQQERSTFDRLSDFLKKKEPTHTEESSETDAFSALSKYAKKKEKVNK